MRLRSLIFGLGCWLLAPALLADQAEQQLQAYLAEIRSLEAGFEQQLLDARGQRMQKTEGEMRLLKPGRFYWETRNPFPEVLVSDGESLWLYDPDLEQVTIQKLDQRMAYTPALILSGETATLSDDFEITRRQESQQEIFTLTPLAGDSLFEQMELYFRDGQIEAIHLEDSLGQKTRVELLNPRYNQPLDPSGFDFVLPENVDVIQE
ncbi:outer membrane lipoprotein carrier protein [Marinospirillum celere]|uniref:Outer-membrane lipoprotein carrier protein n=1 Tax=Marinospirillum celere TaxID=1122252 RepID=A0A1I1G739_9GAMM|nr:outer membrane lipoprotein chaperone LolA [Marinospirillum celere]SFC05153.1 outer membrane lipoprotein carrier protein [Marinospirillum celere]